jgi:CDP-glucose 4,6-dehydratase
MFADVYKGKTVLVTGHTGFKGAWLSLWLHKLGAKVVGLSLKELTEPSHFKTAALAEFVDDRRMKLEESEQLTKLLSELKPDFIFNLAAQSLVGRAYSSPVSTMLTNAIGSATLLDCVRANLDSCVLVMVTSDKVYLNQEWPWGYRETDKIGGFDPYSASKGMAELAINCFVESFFSSHDNQDVRIGVGRAGNVIGGGDWSENRIFPDCVRSWLNSSTLNLRNPNSTRPWQHVLEPLSGYLLLGQLLFESRKHHGEAFNFGPLSQNNFSVIELIEEIKVSWESVSWNIEDCNSTNILESGLLKLNCDKAHHELGWEPTLTFSETVSLTVDWYQNFYFGKRQTRELSLEQIDNYCKKAKKVGANWTK